VHTPDPDTTADRAASTLEGDLAAPRLPWPRPGSSLALALRATPASRRALTGLWLNWWHDTARIPLSIEDVGVAEAKLAWWMGAVGEAAAGQAQHPLLRAMTQAAGPIPDALPPWDWWQDQLQALQGLLHQNRWMDEPTLARHVAQSTGNAAACVAWLQGARDAATLDAARLWGQALRRHHMMARLGQDARSGWVHVPVDTLQRFEVKAHQLVKPQRGQTPEGWGPLLVHLHAQAARASQQARDATGALPASQRQLLRPLAVLDAVLGAQSQTVSRQGDAVLFERLTLTPWRKSWLAQQQAWRLWWGA
jgi:phytoene synthase